MMLEKEVFPDYEWELDFCCARCGSTHYLLLDEESEEIYCRPCLELIRRKQTQQPEMVEIFEEDEFVL
jgi:late competence protein required for DNA uptake (superfamily II DNA/RNA helicase)